MSEMFAARVAFAAVLLLGHPLILTLVSARAVALFTVGATATTIARAICTNALDA